MARELRVEEPTKIFFDLLFEYKTIIYIFKYGFYWEDEMTELLLSKSSQRVRELMNIISSSAYENCVSTPWCENLYGKKAKKSGRLLIKSNHYQRVQNRWFQDLCGCCGSFHDAIAERQMDSCGQQDYSTCKDERGTCSYRKLCMFKEEKKRFLELLRGVEKAEAKNWRENEVCRNILKHYGDVIDDREGSLRLKENCWVARKNEKEPIFKSGDEHRRFLDMVRFFSSFAPMGVLGGNFLRRLSSGFGPSLIVARNLPQDYEFEQEYAYRCLYAMSHGKMVVYEEREYIPVKLFFRDRDMTGLPEHLYLEALEWGEDERRGKCAVELPLFGGRQVKPGRKIDGEIPLSEGRKERETRDYEVEFYYNESTEYLIKRREEGWKSGILKVMPSTSVTNMESPYYGDRTIWKVDVVTYRIETDDIPGFLMFIQSFGDFAAVISPWEPVVEKRRDVGAHLKGSIAEHESLLSIYNSDSLIKEAREAGRALPPRSAELQWLKFILEEYPGFCGMFLDDDCLRKIYGKVQAECGEENWFDRRRFDYGCRARDIAKNVHPKYKRILNAMYEGRIFRYEYHGKTVHIFPYAMEYDVTRHLAGNDREPVDIMCYHLDEKRTANILYRNIETRSSMSQEEYCFSEEEKMYHILAYAIRCGLEGKMEIEEKAGNLLDHIWKQDPRGGDNYNRCVRKKVSGKTVLKTRDFFKEYQKFEELCENDDNPAVKERFHNAFDYWKSTGSGPDNQYQAFLLSCLADGYKRLRSPRAGRAVKHALDAVRNEEIWELIKGEQRDGVLNEIAFFNENLKNACISFVLNDGSQENVRKVCGIFRNFICAGEKERDGRLRFTVSYEMFHYRKIHMALMALGGLAVELEPKELAGVIEKRMKNRERFLYAKGN